jgi:drug/metabolite transporter (DMT)-like permease/RimJ/RimL family protein N-acetyltransferase
MKSSNHQQQLKANSRAGYINGFIGMLIFSGSLPATRIAIRDFSPAFLTVMRAAIAGVLALCILLIYKEKRPTKAQIIPLIIVSMGVVVGYPLLSGLALQYITSAHAMVFLGMLPLTTAIFGVFRGGEHPRPAFWLFSILGSLFVIGFAVAQGLTASPTGDILMLLAVILCGLGYAEGAKLSKTLGGWQVISWALVLSLVFMAPATLFLLPKSFTSVGTSSWIGLLYVSVFSMLIGFVFWYRGLAQGGIAAVGQLQLLQPFFGLALAATLLHEQVSMGMLAVTVGVILCVAGSKKFAKPVKMILFNKQPVMEDDLIRIIPLKTTDFEALYKVASDPLVWEQHPNKDRYRREVFLNFFKGAIDSGGAFLVLDKATGEVVGSSRYYDAEEADSIAIGYTFVGRVYWGKQYNPALKKLMIDHALQHFNAVIFHIGSENIRSQKAIERLGAKKVGEQEIAYYGEPAKPNFIYQIKKAEWLAPKAVSELVVTL